jgi:ABC-type nitrate/sulfonate/bicarbonate transport system substrate-binding protein
MTETLWYTRCPVPTAFSIAVWNGWIDAEFRRDGIAVRSLATSGDRAARQAHFQQTLPNFFRHGGNTPPLFSRSRGRDVRLIGLSFNESLRVVLVRPDSDIESVGDLAGKRLSIPRRLNDTIDFWRTTVLRGFVDILADAGLSLADTVATEVEIGRAFVDDSQSARRGEDSLWRGDFMLGHQREEALALIRGEVDAIYSQGSIAAIVQGFTGARAVFDSRDTTRWVNNDAPLTLTVTGDLLDARPDLVDRWLARVLAASRWAADNEREAKRSIAIEGGIPEDLVDRAFSPEIHRQLGVSLDAVSLERLESQHRQLLDRGFIDRPIDFARFVDFGPLRRAEEILAAGRLVEAAQ